MGCCNLFSQTKPVEVFPPVYILYGATIPNLEQKDMVAPLRSLQIASMVNFSAIQLRKV